ncbi:ABC transporter ATP-binding protein [Aquibacillus sp. 3ASR75-11]|uniref:ABC transporter ATP-binding protein n=1 Tax=Terrihalobacillus insolitus TaxID=2950438 RepID=A0A9X3WSX3_9BACI|nr:ABC transporter ATP-binding protein [Terrihalobacillus insolitus]MDC3423651.1 ABC transporter ATP-binding protein [Terrihalobacillus insolitus]
MLRVEKIQKVFNNKSFSTEVLNDISLSISKGCWLSIVGPSGSGKSTLLNITSGLLKPDSGKVFFNDRNVYELNDQERSNLRRKHIGFVFQDFKLLPYYSVLDNVILPLYYDEEKNKLYERAKELLQVVGIRESLFFRLPEGLSGGEKQRVAIARALIANPEVLICDEPTGNLDWENRNQIIKLFSSLKEQGKTIVLVTHDTNMADCGDEVYQLLNGKIALIEAAV